LRANHYTQFQDPTLTGARVWCSHLKSSPGRHVKVSVPGWGGLRSSYKKWGRSDGHTQLVKSSEGTRFIRKPKRAGAVAPMLSNTTWMVRTPAWAFACSSSLLPDKCRDNFKYSTLHSVRHYTRV